MYSTQRYLKDPKPATPVASTRLKGRPYLLYYLLAIILYAAVFTVWQVEPVPLEVHLLAILLAATCLIPFFRWLARGQEEVPVFEIMALSYALQFSMPVYTQPNLIRILDGEVVFAWDDIRTSLIYVELGMVVFIVAYYLTRNSRLLRSAPRLNLALDPQRRTSFIVGAIVIGSLFNVIQVLGLINTSGLLAIVSLIARQLNIGIILLSHDVYQTREPNLAMNRLLFGSIALAFLLGLATGMLESAFIPLVLWLLVRWHLTKKLPLLWIVSGFALFLVLNPVKFDYRERVWFGRQTYSLVDRLSLWGELAADRVIQIAEPEGGKTQNTIYDSLARFDLIHRFTHVHRITPTYLPYYGGETYEYFLYAWVPRLFWPGKPTASLANNTMDVDYGLKYPGSSATIGIGLLPEAYANFGVWGILLVMSIQGMVIAVLDGTLNGPGSDGGRAIYLSVMVFLFNGIGSSASIWFGALLQNVAANALIIWPFTKPLTDQSRYLRERPSQKRNVNRVNSGVRHRTKH